MRYCVGGVGASARSAAIAQVGMQPVERRSRRIASAASRLGTERGWAVQGTL